MVVAALGVRALGQFINVEPDAMGGAQHSWFTTIDILFTGALLAGGSDPIHRLMNLYRKIIDSSIERAETNPKSKRGR